MRILRAHPGAALGVVAFTIASLLLTALVAGTLTGDNTGDRLRIRAEFRDATALQPGDDVRIAGVRVGRVLDTELVDDLALVTLEVDAEHVVDTATTASIAYLNLMGQRYVALEQGPQQRGTRPLRRDEVIPVARTRPALDLSAMFNAFRPLFDALQPADLNQLAENVVAVLQGQGGTLSHLTQQVAGLSSHLASRDELIGSVLDNLTLVLGTTDEHRAELVSLIDALGSLAAGLAEDREQLGASLTHASDLAVLLEDLTDRVDEPLLDDLAQLRQVAQHLAEETPLLAEVLTAIPVQFDVYLRTLGYGSHLNVYVCTLSAAMPGSPVVDMLPADAHSARCR